ncbi:uncharacterized protein LOC144522634 [Sander vitreus]
MHLCSRSRYSVTVRRKAFSKSLTGGICSSSSLDLETTAIQMLKSNSTQKMFMKTRGMMRWQSRKKQHQTACCDLVLGSGSFLAHLSDIINMAELTSEDLSPPVTSPSFKRMGSMGSYQWNMLRSSLRR